MIFLYAIYSFCSIILYDSLLYKIIESIRLLILISSYILYSTRKYYHYPLISDLSESSYLIISYCIYTMPAVFYMFMISENKFISIVTSSYITISSIILLVFYHELRTPYFIEKNSDRISKIIRYKKKMKLSDEDFDILKKYLIELYKDEKPISLKLLRLTIIILISSIVNRYTGNIVDFISNYIK